jgi:hypothetical protein
MHSQPSIGASFNKLAYSSWLVSSTVTCPMLNIDKACITSKKFVLKFIGDMWYIRQAIAKFVANCQTWREWASMVWRSASIKAKESKILSTADAMTVAQNIPYSPCLKDLYNESPVKKKWEGLYQILWASLHEFESTMLLRKLKKLQSCHIRIGVFSLEKRI